MAAAAAHPFRLGVRSRLAASGAGVQRGVSAAVRRPWVWVVCVGALWALPLGRSLTRALPAQPAVLAGDVPAFSLSTENNTPLTTADLRGRMWIVRFAVWDSVEGDGDWSDTHLRLQHRLRNMGDSARLLTVTTDPDHDTADRLYRYARAHYANPYQWTFATGPSGDLHDALSAVLRREHPELLADSTLADSHYFVLLDPETRIRGFYPPDEVGVEHLIADCGLIANLYEPARAPEGPAS